MQQMVALGTLAFASLLFGTHSIHRLVVFVATMFVVAIAMSPSNYVGNQVVGVCGIVLATLGCGIGARLQQNSSGLKWFLLGIVVAACTNALEGLLQWFGIADALWPWVVDTGRRGLAYGAFRQSNLFATFLCVGIVCTTWLVHLRRLSTAMAWVLVFVLACGVATSHSRTGGLELAALCIGGVIWHKQQTNEITRLCVGPLFIYGLATWFLTIAARLLEFEFMSAAEKMANAFTDVRLVLWQNAAILIAERPWSGWGWFGVGYGHYVTLFEHRFSNLLDDAHNLPLQLAVEFGIPFTFVFMGVLVFSTYKGKPWLVLHPSSSTQTDQPRNRSFAWAILFMIIGLHSMLEKPLSYFGFIFLAGFATGYLLILPDEKAIKPWYDAVISMMLKACAAILITLSLVAWDQYSYILQIYEAPFNDRDARRVAIANASDAWLFDGYLDFIKIGITHVTPENALEVKKSTEKLLHFSAEPQVIQPLLLSLWYLHETENLKFHALRFCRAFPIQFGRWNDFYRGHPILRDSGNLSPACEPQSVVSSS